MSATGGTGADQKGLMDATYALHRHFYDFTRKFYLLGRDRLVRRLAPPREARCWRSAAARRAT